MGKQFNRTADVQTFPITPFEKRLLLDGVIEWDLSPFLNHQFDAVNDLKSILETRVSDFSYLSNSIADGLDSALSLFDSLAPSLDAMGGDTSSQLAVLRSNLGNAFNEIRGSIGPTLISYPGDALKVELNDILDDSETKIVEFSNAANGAVNVAISIPDINLDFSALLQGGLSVEADFLSFDFDDAGRKLHFTISPSTNYNNIGFTVGDFRTDLLFATGGVVTELADSLSLDLGLISAEVTSVELAEFRIEANFESTFALTASVDVFTNSYSVYTPSFPSDWFSFDALVREVGGSQFEDITTDERYALLEVGINGTLGFTDEADQSNYDYTAEIGVSAILENSVSVPVSGLVAQFIENTELSINVDLDVDDMDADVKAKLELVIETLASMGVAEIGEFLQAIGYGIADAVEAAVGDITIPFTDVFVSEVVADIVDTFTGLQSLFLIAPEDLGFVPIDPDTGVLTPLTDTFSPAALTFNATPSIIKLNAFDRFDFMVLSQDADGLERTQVSVDLGEQFDWNNSFANDDAKLDVLVAALNEALGSLGFVFTTSGNMLSVTNNNSPAHSLGLIGARRKDQDAGPADLTFELSDFGFSADDLLKSAYMLTDTADEEEVLIFANSGGEWTWYLPDDIGDTLSGVETLRFYANIDGDERILHIRKPDAGWGEAEDPNTAGIAAAIDEAIVAAGLPLTVTMDGDIISVGGVSGIQSEVEFGLRPDLLTRAFDISTLIYWVNTALDDVEILSGSTLELTQDGALIFTFPDVMASLNVVTAGLGNNLETNGIGGGQLSGLSLNAKLALELNAALNAGVGIGLLDLAQDLMDAAESTNVLTASGLATDLGASVLTNTFFNDLSVYAEVTGVADKITGMLDLGLMAASVGADDPEANFGVINAQFALSLIGTDEDGFAERLSLINLIDALTYQNDQGLYEPFTGLNTLVGNVAFKGGIVTDGGGLGLTVNGDEATRYADLEIIDVRDFSLSDGEELAFLQLYLGDVQIDVAGISNLNEGFIDGLSITIEDIIRPLGSLEWTPLGDGAESVLALADLGEGDVLDGFNAILGVLDSLSGALADDLPFLSTDIPLLNFSLLDAIDFAKDFGELVAELSDDPDMGLARIDRMLESILGDDTVSLSWDTEKKIFEFGLSLTFLDDYAREIPFQFDLDQLVGDALVDYVGEDVAGFLTGLVDIEGDANIIFDPNLSLALVFGLDLSNTAVVAAPLAGTTTALSALATASAVSFAKSGTNDLTIRWKDQTDPDNVAHEVVRIDLDGADTLGEAITLIDDALQTAIGTNVSFAFDADTGTVTLSDSNSSLIFVDDVKTLFGEEVLTSEALDPEAINVFSPHAFTVQALAAEDYSAAYRFSLAFGQVEGEPGTQYEIALDADEERLTIEAFADALNEAIAAIDVARSDITPFAPDGWTMSGAQLLTAEIVDGSTLMLVATNFSEAAGVDPYAMTVAGVDDARDVLFQIDDMNGANLSRVLGFEQTDGSALVSSTLYQTRETGAPRLYLDTEQSGVNLTFSAGVVESLNLVLGIGPLEISVVDGTAAITAGDGSTEPAFLSLGFEDVDGDEHVDQYDLSDLFNLIADGTRSISDFLSVGIGIGIEIDLGFEDSLGLIDPGTAGLAYTANLLQLAGDGPERVALSDFDLSNIGDFFAGDLLSIYSGTELTGDFSFDLPDLGDIFANFNPLEFLNNPRMLLGGLDIILNQMQNMFDDYLGEIDLPVVGDAIGAGVTFFDDFRFNILDQALVFANTPDENGDLPSTIGLLTGWFNDKLNDLFNPDGERIQFIQAELVIEDIFGDSYLYGTINFNEIIFDELLNIDFDLGVPGFNLGLDSGSAVRLTLDYGVNIGFGLNRNGFFLLNDTDEDEIKISFMADAGTLQGSASIFNILGVSLDAITLPEDDGGNILTDYSNEDIEGQGNADGTAYVRAMLGADLFGDAGLEIVDADADDSQIVLDLSGIGPTNALGQELSFEKAVYISAVDFDSLIAFSFVAEVNVQLGIEGNILDPSTGKPLLIGGAQVLPSVRTELVLIGGYDSSSDDGFVMEHLEFLNVRIDASVLYEAIIAPVIDPMMDFINPLAAAFGWLNEAPFSFATDLVANAFPIFGIANSVIQLITDIADFANMMQSTGGQFVYGNFDFTESAKDGGKIETSEAEYDFSLSSFKSPDLSSLMKGAEKPFGVFGNINKGIALELPLLTDPFSAINILTGDYDMVGLVEVHFTLFNLDIPRTSIVDLVLDSINAPGFVATIISTPMKAFFEVRLMSRMTVGYDLSGITNFIDTQDPERLLDGVYIDATPGSLLNIYFGIDFALNLGIAGLKGGAYAGFQLAFNDPNDDGKLRIPELIYIVETGIREGGNIFGALSYIFEGQFEAGANLSLWVGIDLGFFSLKIDIEVFDVSIKAPFGHDYTEAVMSKNLAPGETAILNVGARAGGNMTDVKEDDDDTIILVGPNSPINVTLANSQGQVTGSFSENAGGVIIPAGEGDNLIDLDKFTAGIPTLIYSGSGNDEIILPTTGLNVVFAGSGRDRITTKQSSSGTYVIFGDGDEDIVDIMGGNVIYFGDSDFGMRDVFVNTFANGGLNATQMLNMLGLNSDGTVSDGGQANYTVPLGQGAFATKTLAGLLDIYTQNTQVSAGRDDESITLGAGNHIVFTGRGDDTITVAGGGMTQVFSGGGADLIDVQTRDLVVEAGSGSDIVFADTSGVSEIWGWGHAAGEAGLTGGSGLDSLAIRDGADLIIATGGNDVIYGQLGKDIIAGGDGADSIYGGLGTDLATGGNFEIVAAGTGLSIDIYTVDPSAGFGMNVVVDSEDRSDGDDMLSGGDGDDVLFGAGGADALYGGFGNDVLVGDFTRVTLSSNFVAQSMVASHVDSANNGSETMIDGNEGNDIIMAGGGGDTVTDLYGNNIVVGDHADIDGARLNEFVKTITHRLSTTGDSDLITMGSGLDIVIGGDLVDTIGGGGGDDILVGDHADVNFVVQTVSTTFNGRPGSDVINGESGDDLIIGGGAGDTLRGESGGDLIYGDEAFVDLLNKTITSLQQNGTSDNGVYEGSDTIYGGTGNDILVGGRMGDRILGDRGEDVLIGDSAAVSWKNVRDIATFINTHEGTGAADYLETADEPEGVRGDDIVIGQSGNDTIITRGGDDFIAADLATFVFSDPATALTEQSAADRIVTVEGVRTDLGFDDNITVGDGADIVIAGFGSDLVVGEGGQDFLFGDSMIVNREWQVDAAGVMQEVMIIETNFAYLDGGYDVIWGDYKVDDMSTYSTDDGADVMIGSLGPDLFYGNTEDDAIFSDGYAGLFRAEHGEAYETTPMANRFLYTSNFAGPGAVDVVSAAQQDDSIGAPLNLAAQQTQGLAPVEKLSVVLDALEDIDTLDAVAALMRDGVDIRLIAQSILSDLALVHIFLGDLSDFEMEMMIRALTDAMRNANIASAQVAAE